MLHKATVTSGNKPKATETFEYLMDAVSFCNKEADQGDTCEVTESYESLTGIEDYVTIMSWVFQKEFNSEVHKRDKVS